MKTTSNKEEILEFINYLQWQAKLGYITGLKIKRKGEWLFITYKRSKRGKYEIQ